MNALLSVVMVNIAGAYWELRQFAEIASIATEAKHTLEAGELTNCYVFAQCKRRITVVQLFVTR